MVELEGGGGEAGGGGLARVVDGGAVVVRVRWGCERARSVGHFLGILVGVGGALDVVKRPAWGTWRRRGVYARLRVGFGVHCHPHGLHVRDISSMLIKGEEEKEIRALGTWELGA